MRNLSRRIQKNLGTLTKIAEERLGNVRTSQSFAGENLEVGRYNHQIKKIFALGRKEAFITATYFSATSMMGNMTILALLYVGGGMVQSGAISIGELTSFLMYTAYAGSSLFGLSGFWSELMKGVGAASRLFELQDRKPTINPTVGLPVPSARGLISFSNLSFSYPTRPAVMIFQDLNFDIPQGSNVAVVGPSGGGKSTIASLLLRFYTPTKGSISIEGTDISQMNVKQLRRKIGVVAQEPVLFSGSIADNIAYAKPRATRAEIIAAARKANCKFIEDFPDGLDTSVGPRGAQLSGGQKQRIAIARALVKNPDILILDEGSLFPPPLFFSLLSDRCTDAVFSVYSNIRPRRRIRDPGQPSPRRPPARQQHHHLHRPPPLHHQALRQHHRALLGRESRAAGQLRRPLQAGRWRVQGADGVADEWRGDR